MLTVVAATLLGCAGTVLAQAAEEESARSTSSSRQRAETAVIPGRYIVLLDDGGVGQTSARSGDRERDARLVADQLSREGKVEAVTHTYGSALRGFAARIPPGDLPEVKNDPRVDAVVADREVRALAQSVPSGVDRVDADESSTIAGDGGGAVDADIAILDTGVYPRHPDLNVVGGRNCVGRDRKAWGDGNGHGTHVAGTAAAKDDDAGVVGVAPGARLWSVKVLDRRARGTISSVMCGIDWVTARAATIEVANMSIGDTFAGADDAGCGWTGSRAAAALNRAVCRSVDAGVFYAVAAGNGNSNFANVVPASFDQVLTVTAMADFDGEPGGDSGTVCGGAQDDRVRLSSNWTTAGAPDAAHTIAAPGVCIESTFLTRRKRGGKVRMKPSYETLSGTSMASPHVAGTAALCIATSATTGKCNGGPADVKEDLRADAQQRAGTDPTAPDYYGFVGDPNAGTADKYYGFLEYAGGY